MRAKRKAELTSQKIVTLARNAIDRSRSDLNDFHRQVDEVLDRLVMVRARNKQVPPPKRNG